MKLKLGIKKELTEKNIRIDAKDCRSRNQKNEY